MFSSNDVLCFVVVRLAMWCYSSIPQCASSTSLKQDTAVNLFGRLSKLSKHAMIHAHVLLYFPSDWLIVHRTSLTAVRFCRLDTVDEDEDDGLQRFYQLTRPESLMVYELISREGSPNNNPVPAPNPDPDSDPSSTQS